MSEANERDGALGGSRTRMVRQIALSALALAWERLWPALWPASAVLGLFAVLTAFGLWEVTPWWLHLALLAAFAAALGGASWCARGAFRLPLRGEAIRRLERTSGVAHRPLTALLDAPAGGARDGRAAALWRAHRARMAKRLAALRVAWPAAGLAARDPFALRAAIVLLLVVAAAGAGERLWPRLAGALGPDFSGLTAEPGRLTAWIDPPDYTGLPPVYLTAEAPEEATVVAGSVLLARVHGGGRVPRLRRGGGETAFETAGADNFALEAALHEDGEVAIVQGRHRLGRWSVRVVSDAPPAVDLAKPPEQTQRGVLRLEYAAVDDFGLRRVLARIDREEGPVAPIDLALPLPGLEPTEAREASYHDLTPHPWAGLPVLLTLSAADTAGQTGSAEPVPMVLPERPFSHPVAKELVAQRRVLALDPDATPDVRRALARIMEAPKAFGDDVVVYLGLRTARARLLYRHDVAGFDSVLELLWDLALRLEDGALSLAERDLRAAQEALREALEADASPERLAELMDELQEALDKYLELLSEAGAEAPPERERAEALDEEALLRSRDDFTQMLEEMRDMAMTGAREAAQEMLQQLQEMLENLQAAGRAPKMSTEGDPLLKRLQEIMNDQDALLGETFDRAVSRGRDEQMSPGAGEAAAERQEALRRQLGEVMRQIGEGGEPIPGGLGRAERLMRDSREELRRGRPDRAIDPQAQALQQLQEGASALVNRLTAAGQGEQPGAGARPRPFDERRDPLGRLSPGIGGDPTGYVEIPKKSDVQRSREILDELYRRAGERHRPRDERDYIDRLLRWY